MVARLGSYSDIGSGKMSRCFPWTKVRPAGDGSVDSWPRRWYTSVAVAEIQVDKQMRSARLILLRLLTRDSDE